MVINEFDEELRELKREIIETRGLIIKTNNLTNALSADLKSIAKRQQGYERRLNWNSAAAYLVFVVVVFVAQIVASNRWLSRFAYGPAEWVWRALTYGQMPPMKLKSGPVF